jgi:CHAT domain-containing protein/Tfp pilus assembly protein PilF
MIPWNKKIRFTLFILPFALPAILFLTTCLTPSILVTREQNTGDMLFNLHKYNDAIIHYEQMLIASNKLGIYRSPGMESDVHRKIADCYEMMGKYEQAMDYIHKAMVLDSIDNNQLNIIKDHRLEGKIFVYLGLFRNGISSLERSLYLSEGMDQSLKGVNRTSIAETYLALGQLYAVTGSTAKALDYTKKALPIFLQDGVQAGVMESYLNLGNIYSDLGDVTSARKFAENSIKIASVLSLGTARQNQLLASVYASAGEYETAVRFQEKALSGANVSGITGQIIWATIGLGDIYREIGDLNKAEKYYKSAGDRKDTMAMTSGSLEASLNLRMGDVLRANTYFASEGSITGAAISSLRLAEIMMRKGIIDSAIMLLNSSARGFYESHNIQGIANIQLLKGSLFVNSGNLSEASLLLDSASRMTEFPETVWQSYFHMGRMFEKLRQDEKAIASYRNAISVIEKIRGNLTTEEFKSTFFDSKREVYDRLINILLRNNKPVEAFRYSEQARARAFYDILANKKIDFKGSVSGDLISLEQEKRLEMQKLYRLLQKGDAISSDISNAKRTDILQLRNSLALAQSEYEEILQKIKLNNPAYSEMVAAVPVDMAKLRTQLDKKTAVIAYWIGETELTYWLINCDTVFYERINIEKTILTSLVENARKSIQSNSLGVTASELARLYSILIGPVENNLSGIADLVIIPNGPLHFLPFQALIDRKGRYLVQNYNLIYAPSASVYMICNNMPVKPGSRFLGMALSDLVIDNKEGLPGTENELRNILPLFPDNISAIGSEGTETFVRRYAGDYNFIHFATHGSYNYRQPLYSYLLFPPSEDNDGRLNVYEVFEMNINAKLVTLSACETGLGNLSQGDELTGLSRAFLFAGSSSVLVSLWAVADYPTSLLMTSFYRYLKDHSVQEALTLAQRDVIKLFPQPQYWSPFILIGNGKISAD